MIHSTSLGEPHGLDGAPANTGEPPADEVRMQLERILASKSFSRSERLSQFLRFVVEEKCQGGPADLKEYMIGAQVYERGASFDPTTDTIVRVEARRLRSTLEKYYTAEGRSDPVLIQVPKGRYEPVFHWQAPSPVEPTSRASLSSIAVLPFDSFGPEEDEDGFCDGLTVEIINAVAQVEGVRVTARTSAFAFKRRYQDIRSIGEALNAAVVVEGSVRRDGRRLRITVQLIDIGDGYHLWSRRFEREMKGVFAIQDDVARAVAEVVRLQLGQTQGIEAERVS